MILPLHHALRQRLRDVLRERYGLAPDDQPPLAVESPKLVAHGDLALPAAFELARRLRKAPRLIGQELAAALGPVAGIDRIDVAPQGYVNCFLARAPFLRDRLAGAVAPLPVPPLDTIVEHTAINPNKAAHIGHVRNAALGDTLVRALRYRGVPVEVQNYIDDTGVQLADVVVGFQALERQSLDEVRALADTSRFDHVCWDLYARVTAWYAADAARLKHRADALHDIEHGGTAAADIAAFIADRIVRCHLRTMGRLGIDYDLLTWEGDILRLRFWARAFEILKADGVMYFQAEGRHAGCWVMQIDEEAGAATEPVAGVEPAEEEAETTREKVIVRSNGTVTYVGKDIAYQFWKHGLLGLDFHYRPFAERLDGRTLWATTSDPAAGRPDHPAFGAADMTYNVIDVRQSYLQKLLQQALRAMGHADQADHSVHFSYEMVALSHATARELGYELDADEARKPFVEVSGRKGLGVKADDLIDLVERKATEEVARRNASFAPDEAARIGRMIGVAAVRYFMVKYSRGKVIAFDLDEALSFEGESGPYLQYAAVRASNILAKLKERDGLDDAGITRRVETLGPAPLDEEDELWSLVLEAARLDEILEQVVRSLEFSVLAKWAFGLAQAFNAFYHRAPVLAEEREDVRLWRAAGVLWVRNQLTAALGVMGIAVPPRM